MISVIVPYYNAVSHIKQCVRGLQNQICDSFDVWLVDDGSTDGTDLLAFRLIAGDVRFHLVRIEHQGVSAARNAALEQAQGEFICFVDVDDVISADYLQSLVDDAKHQDVDLVVHGLSHVFPTRTTNIAVCQEGRYEIEKNPEMFFGSFNIGALGSVCGKLFKTDILRLNEISFSPDVFMCEDQEFVIRYLCVAKTVFLSKQSNYMYIAVPKSGSTTYRRYEIEAHNFCCLETVWHELMRRFTCNSLEKAYSSFIGSFLHRLISSALNHPADRMTRKSNLSDFETRFSSDYCHYYKPKTLYTCMLRFFVLCRCYFAFCLLQSLAETHYSIENRYV